MKLYYLLFFLIYTFCTMPLSAQNSVNSSGKKISGTGGTLNFSIGQMIYGNNHSSTGSVNQGVQHSYEITTINSTESTLRNIELIIFPNPTSNNLNLKIDDLEIKNMSYQLFNLEGKLLESGTIRQANTSINMKERLPDTYLLKIIKKEKVLNIFRIVKY